MRFLTEEVLLGRAILSKDDFEMIGLF